MSENHWWCDTSKHRAYFPTPERRENNLMFQWFIYGQNGGRSNKFNIYDNIGKKKIRKKWICVTPKTSLRLNNYLWWRIRINTKNWGNVKQCLSNWLSHQGTSMELFYFVCLVCLFWKLYVCLCLLDNKHFYLFTIANMQNRHVFWTTTFLMIYIFIWTNLG